MIPVVALSDLTVMRGGAAVLRGLSLRLGMRERLAIVGPNGAGKTTLLRCIVGLERPVAGRIALFGTACGGERDFRLFRPRIGFLFQDSDDQLFCPTVAEDVAFGPLNTGATAAGARARALEALAALGIAHLAERVTHRLSGGEKRLVCLAGLLAMRPEVLLLDEPTNGIDAENMARLRAALETFDGAMILVSHDAGFVAGLATRAMMMRDGALVEAEIHDHPHLHSHPHLHPKG
ncbi:energy-coupling factor ABC transporter ATP-binding protein [Paenirhodobacter populi]|uniref:energy-coupling factor ABC transporter ATP-binding protein n=1 Tax=Paenirhodobacter populi TaxID=2306993 RepID=UPI000FE3DC2D|nr:ABC transporter ATP-binding protein [Sinirhodobacter populi]RWR08789.1 ABC transporter ATP-binding protein [Sinirhodobacter populi]